MKNCHETPYGFQVETEKPYKQNYFHFLSFLEKSVTVVCSWEMTWQ